MLHALHAWDDPTPETTSLTAHFVHADPELAYPGLHVVHCEPLAHVAQPAIMSLHSLHCCPPVDEGAAIWLLLHRWQEPALSAYPLLQRVHSALAEHSSHPGMMSPQAWQLCAEPAPTTRLPWVHSRHDEPWLANPASHVSHDDAEEQRAHPGMVVLQVAQVWEAPLPCT